MQERFEQKINPDFQTIMPSSLSLYTHLLESNIAAIKNDLDSVDASFLCETFYRGLTSLSIAIIKGMPDDIVLLLLTKSPYSAHIKNRDGTHTYPIHVCAEYGSSTTVIRELLREFPQALNIKAITRSGMYMSPLEISRENESLSASAKEMFRLPVSYWSATKNSSESAQGVENSTKSSSANNANRNEEDDLLREVSCRSSRSRF